MNYSNITLFCTGLPNGLRYPRVGGRGFALREGKTRSQKNTCKSRRLPHVGCTLCWQALRKTRRLKTRAAAIKLTRLLHELNAFARTKNVTCVSTGSTTAQTLAKKDFVSRQARQPPNKSERRFRKTLVNRKRRSQRKSMVRRTRRTSRTQLLWRGEGKTCLNATKAATQ